MSEMPQGPSWWQASDGRWYPPETHPSYQQFRSQSAASGTPAMILPAAGMQPGMLPAGAGVPPGMLPLEAGMAPGTPVMVPPAADVPPGSLPVNAGGGGVPKGLIVAGAILLVVVVGGWLTVSWALGRIGDKLGGAVGGGDCSLVSTGDVEGVLNGRFDVIQLGGITKIATPVLDARVLADATTCWATEDGVSQARLVRIALLKSSGAAQRFQQERAIAQGTKEDKGGGITVESQPYFNKDVQAGDEAFCTTTDFTGSSGVLVRHGDTLVYVSLTSGTFTPQLDPSLEPGGPIKFADDDTHCDQAQKLAAKVLSR